MEGAVADGGRTVGNEGEHLEEYGVAVEEEGGVGVMVIAFYDWYANEWMMINCSMKEGQ